MSFFGDIYAGKAEKKAEVSLKQINVIIEQPEFLCTTLSKNRKINGSKIHKDDIMRCYSGVKLMQGAREVVEELQARGIFVAIVSSGVDLLIGTIANMLKVDDWAANGFEWDENNHLVKGLPTRVYSHNKGLMVEKLIRIKKLNPQNVVSIGDSSTDLSMKVGESGFIGFNPARERATNAFKNAGVPIIENKDLREIWPILFPNETI